MAKLEVTKESRLSKQKIAKDEKKDKAAKEFKKDLDSDLITALEESDNHEARVELLLTQIIRELKAIGKK